MTHICVSKLNIIGSDNGLSPDRRQAIIWTNAGLLLIRPLGTNFSEILSEILTFSFKKMRLKVSSAKRRPFCLGLNVYHIRTWKWHPRISAKLAAHWSKNEYIYLYSWLIWFWARFNETGLVLNSNHIETFHVSKFDFLFLLIFHTLAKMISMLG